MRVQEKYYVVNFFVNLCVMSLHSILIKAVIGFVPGVFMKSHLAIIRSDYVQNHYSLKATWTASVANKATSVSKKSMVKW